MISPLDPSRRRSPGLRCGRLALTLLLGAGLVVCCQASGIVVAWGNDNNQQAQLPTGLTNVVALAAGTIHSLALKSNGTVAGWGDDFFGQASVPGDLTNVAAISAGDTFSLALLSNGTVTAWGNQPVMPDGLTNVIAIAAGWYHCLALQASGTVVSWGDSNAVPAGLDHVITIAAGDAHSLALRSDGTVTAWGDDSFGQTDVPPGLSNIVAIAAGKDHSAAVRNDGYLFVWGRNDDGQTNVPLGLTNVVSVTAGAYHTVALKENGTLAAWGNDVFNQGVVPVWMGFYQVIAGGFHNLGLVGDGSPVVVLQPRSQTVTVTKNVSLQVLAAGNLPITYQWQKDGTNLPGATARSLQFTNVQLSDAGTYVVRVSNANGNTMSAHAILNPVIALPAVILPPLDTNVLCGESATFSVSVDGTPPFSYQWQFAGNPIPDATNSVLTLSNISLNEAGNYSVVITNAAGAVTSVVASLTVEVEPPYITSLLSADGIQCQAFTYTITAMHNPTSFEATDLPVGLSLNPTNGIISGIPMDAGTFTPTISALNNCATQSEILTLNFSSGAPVITSLLSASGAQGIPFRYVITAIYDPVRYDASQLPLGLSINTNSGVISGVPLENGTFTPTITAFNNCTSYSAILTLDFNTSAPVIRSALLVLGGEDQFLSYRITASGSPSGFGALHLPDGLTLNVTNGFITGPPTYAGEFDTTISATNIWGVGTATLHFSITNKPINGLSIANVTFVYSSPYLLDIQFSLRDDNDPTLGHAVVAPPKLVSVQALESGQPVSSSETGVFLARGTAKQLKANLVLDFTESMASLSNGDTNNDGISDSVEQMVGGAQAFVNEQPATTQIGVYEFHREDFAPQRVLPLTTDKALLNQAIAGIWTNYVGWFPAGSRCWDALTNAILDLGGSNRDEQHYVIFVSDGRDESSLSTMKTVMTLATNNGVQIYCIGFGDELDPTSLSTITTETHGRYYAATNAADLAAQFAQISKDLNGQYLLRWATLKRSSLSFEPSFVISFLNQSATSPPPVIFPAITNIDNTVTPPLTNITPAKTNYTLPPYIPTQHTGTVTVGALRFSADAAVYPTAITLRSAYAPRFVRQLRLHYRANWPCTTSLLSTAPGEMIFNWSLTETNDGTGGKWLLLSSAFPPSLTNSIPFAALGDLIHFNFHDVINPSNAFSFFDVDNTIYTNTGGQKFIIENTNAFFTVYPDLPFHTPVPWLIAHGITNNFPAAEIADPDGDGIPTWREYLANTDPLNAGSCFAVRGLSNDPYGRYQITFNTALNRTYRVETSFDLLNWELVQDNIPGRGGDVTVLDHRYIPWIDQVFYRAVVH